jgi:hypothetical protein
MFSSPLVKEDHSGYIEIGRTSLSTRFGLPVWLMADEKHGVYMVMNLNSQATPVTLKTPDGTFRTDALPLGRIIYQPKSEKTLDILSGLGLGCINFAAKTKQPQVLLNNVFMPKGNSKAQASGTWSFTATP